MRYLDSCNILSGMCSKVRLNLAVLAVRIPPFVLSDGCFVALCDYFLDPVRLKDLFLLS